MKDQRGFTLIELIVVIAIIAVLLGILIPVVIGVLRNASAVECKANRQSILRMFAMQKSLDPNVTIEEIMGNTNGYFDTTPRCSAGGVYTAKQNSDGSWTILCSVHDADPSSTTSVAQTSSSSAAEVNAIAKATGDNVRDRMLALAQKYYTGTNQVRAAISSTASNDAFRNYLLTNVYSDAWPTLSQQMIDTYGLTVAPGSHLYVQPYIEITNKTTASNATDVYVYASTTMQGNSTASLVFDHEKGVWYQRKAGPVPINKSWDTMKKVIQNSAEWVELQPIPKT
jgi:prepilin-type N-terminal cleavage/methylation domain-containing protein